MNKNHLMLSRVLFNFGALQHMTHLRNAEPALSLLVFFFFMRRVGAWQQIIENAATFSRTIVLLREKII